MTATTKEQREDLRRMHEDECESRGHSAYVSNRRVDQILVAFPALLSDSERLAAIEAVTGEEVRDIAEKVVIATYTAQMPQDVASLIKRASAYLLSLSAKVKELEGDYLELQSLRGEDEHLIRDLESKVAEQEEEIERLRGLRQGPHKLGRLADERRIAVDEETRLRRLLTETAVPDLEVADMALGHAKHRISQAVVFDAISTICAQIGDSTTAPRPAQCSTCDDTGIIYGHGSFETSCPACHDADAEAGLAMLGGDGRG